MVEGQVRRPCGRRAASPQTTMQTQLIKPREGWDEDEQHDGRPKTGEIEVLVFAPATAPALITIPNTLSAMQAVVGGYITCFQTGIAGTIGVCHDEGILLGFSPCRYIEATGALIFGPFFVAGGRPMKSGQCVNMHGLTAQQVEETTRVLGPLLTMAQVFRVMRREDEMLRQIEQWNLDQEDDED